MVDITAEETGEFSIEGFTNPEDAILAIIRRHPMREGQVIDTLRNLSFKKKALPKKYNIHDSIKRLEESGKIKKLKYQEKVFWLTMEEKRGHEQSET